MGENERGKQTRRRVHAIIKMDAIIQKCQKCKERQTDKGIEANREAESDGQKERYNQREIQRDRG